MRVIENHEYSLGTKFGARGQRLLESAFNRIVRAFLSTWQQPFSIHLPEDDPDTPPNIARAAVLRDGAVLAEKVSAIADKHVA